MNRDTFYLEITVATHLQSFESSDFNDKSKQIVQMGSMQFGTFILLIDDSSFEGIQRTKWKQAFTDLNIPVSMKIREVQLHIVMNI